MFPFRFGNDRRQRQDKKRSFKKAAAIKKGPALGPLMTIENESGGWNYWGGGVGCGCAAGGCVPLGGVKLGGVVPCGVVPGSVAPAGSVHTSTLRPGSVLAFTWMRCGSIPLDLVR